MKNVLEIIQEIKKSRKIAFKHLENGNDELYWRHIGKVSAYKIIIADEIKLIKRRNPKIKTRVNNLKMINGEFTSEKKLLEALKNKFKVNKK